MQIESVTPVPRKRPPPLWFVTNGDVTVGPVTTNLLVRGVLYRRVPDECLVRERTWSAWRHLERIREVAELRRMQAKGPVEIEPTSWKGPVAPAPLPAFERLEGQLWKARDPEEMLRECLLEAMQATGAWVGAFLSAVAFGRFSIVIGQPVLRPDR